MILAHRKLVAAALVVFLGMGFTATAVAGVISCLPKSCCCGPAPGQAMAHHGQMAPPPSCSSHAAAAACCQVEPYSPRNDAALISHSEKLHPRMGKGAGMGAPAVALPRAGETVVAAFDDGRLKIPQVPIYLRIASLLC